MAIYSGFSHEKWWFSIAMLVYQRVRDFNGFDVISYGSRMIILNLFGKIQKYTQARDGANWVEHWEGPTRFYELPSD